MSITNDQILDLWKFCDEKYLLDNVLVFARRVIELDSDSVNQHWNLIGDLPPTDVPLKLKMINGEILDGIRPDHISNRNKGLGYFEVVDSGCLKLDNDSIVGWQYV